MADTRAEEDLSKKEVSYLLSKTDYDRLIPVIQSYLQEEASQPSTVSSLYFDTSDYQMIRDTINGHFASAIIKMTCCQDNPNDKSPAFLDIRKRQFPDQGGWEQSYRLQSNPISIHNYVKHGLADRTIKGNELKQELAFLQDRYPHLKPKIYLTYQESRLAAPNFPGLSVSLARNLVFRDYDVSLSAGQHGWPLLDEGTVLMTVQSSQPLPEWLDRTLQAEKLPPLSLPKYAMAYLKLKDLAS